jgi:hypothetical protein
MSVYRITKIIGTTPGTRARSAACECVGEGYPLAGVSSFNRLPSSLLSVAW